MPVGVTVKAVEQPVSTTSTYNTQNGFMPVLADWGPVGSSIAVNGLASGVSQLGTPSGVASVYGGRTSTNATAIDAIDTFFNEDGTAAPTLYVSRVVGVTPIAASLALQDATPALSITVTAKYVGAGGNGIFVGIANSGLAATVTLFDSVGNMLAASSALSTVPAIVAWFNSTGYVVAVAGAGALPASMSATALQGGTDDRTHVTLAQVTAALAAFPASLGPGQVFAPNWTDTTLPGLSSALANHAQAFNRVAIPDMDDGQSAGTLVTDLGAFGQSAVASYAGFWAGDRLIPGVAVGTSRQVKPSPVIAALCASGDAGGGADTAPAGVNFSLQYATEPASNVSGAPYDTYSLADLNTLNAAGINTFQRVNGVPTNYGFVSAEPSTQDAVYWQFNHSRLRMYIVAQAQLIGQQFLFKTFDGAGTLEKAFSSALDGSLLGPLYAANALYGATAADAYSIDVGSDVNTPTTIAAGELNARITCSFSPFVQNVVIVVNVQPITSAA